MQACFPLVLAASALLVLAAVPKLAAPRSTIVALRTVGLVWVGRKTVRSLAALELTAAIGAIVVGGRPVDGVVALFYASFSAFLVLALRRPDASCGCTGRDDTPPTIAHLLMTLLFAAGVSAATATGGHTGLLTLSRRGHPGEVLVAGGFAALAAWLGWAILTVPAWPVARTFRGITRFAVRPHL
jgi:hypothetical protein